MTNHRHQATSIDAVSYMRCPPHTDQRALTATILQGKRIAPSMAMILAYLLLLGRVHGTDQVQGVGTTNLPSANTTATIDIVRLSGNSAILPGDAPYDSAVGPLVNTNTPPVPIISSVLAATATVGDSFSYTIVASNAPTIFAATGLPVGLVVDTTTGIISGIPTVVGISLVALTATNAGGDGTQTLTITINPNPPVISSALTASGNVGASFRYAVIASNLPTLYSATGLPAGLMIVPTNGVIIGTPTVASVSQVTLSATNAGGTGLAILTITIAPAAPTISSAASAIGTVGVPFTYTITADNNPTFFSCIDLPTGLTVAANTGVISGTPLQSGTSSVLISATNDGGTDSILLALSISSATLAAPVITSAATASGTTGTAFTFTVTASNSPQQFGASGLPTSLVLDQISGILSGTPVASGSYRVVITAGNSSGTCTELLVLTIAQSSANVPSISSSALANGIVGIPFSFAVVASNAPISYGSTQLPPGLSLDVSTGVISGIPSAAGATRVTISANNTNGTSSKSLVIILAPSPSGSGTVSSPATGGGGGCGLGSGISALCGLVFLLLRLVRMR